MINYNKKNFLLNVFKKASLCRHFENEVYKRVLNKENEKLIRTNKKINKKKLH